MYQFKTDKKLSDCQPNEVVYIPEHGENKYTKSDFLDLCDEDLQAAQTLLYRLEWQHPETLVQEDLLFD